MWRTRPLTSVNKQSNVIAPFSKTHLDGAKLDLVVWFLQSVCGVSIVTAYLGQITYTLPLTVRLVAAQIYFN